MNINITLFTQIATFLVFIWFCSKFVWPPLMSAIEARQKNIADGLAAADKGRQTLEVSSKQADQALKEARDRAAEIISSADKRVAQMIQEAKVAAREEGNREKAAAQSEIEQQISRAKEQLREQVANLAVSGAEKILRREINAQVHADLLTQLRHEIR